MKNSNRILCAALLLTCVAFDTFVAAADERKIWFDTPCPSATVPAWADAADPQSAGSPGPNADPDWEFRTLPIGNGSLGANIFGSTGVERFTFNEKSLWRGGPAAARTPSEYWSANKEAAARLPEIRAALLAGDKKRAARMLGAHFNGLLPYKASEEANFRFGNYTTAGEFRIRTGIPDSMVADYSRSLSLDSALVHVGFRSGGVGYRREYFISCPANVMGIRFSADKPGMQQLRIEYRPNPQMTGRCEPDGCNGWLFYGRLDNNGMAFALRLQVEAPGGRVDVGNGAIDIRGADAVEILLTADTDYRPNPDPDFEDPQTYVGEDPRRTTARWLKLASRKGYDALKAEHVADYRSLFSRVDFALNEDGTWGGGLSGLPTPERLERYRLGSPDYGLETLYYDFGRYLLIASSRPGNLPANLQGIWHNNVDGPWHVDYHNNINLQMNYWPACPTNLAECEMPLFDFIRMLVKPGTRTAQAYWGADGWTASISANIFGFTSPLDSRAIAWNYIPMAGPWLATHIWNHYAFTCDEDFLRACYPMLRGAAEFAADCLWRHPDGYYTLAPSTSPEHGSVDMGATFAHGVVREILNDALAASERLGLDEPGSARWRNLLDSLAPYRVGRYGQLMEWSDDIDDPTDDHRHVNHLYGLHPGTSISPLKTPDLAKAARVVLEHRGDGATGWSMGWKLCQWARLHDGDRAYRLYGNLLRNGTNDNLWDSHPPFQIDGNFGGVAGVTEMIVQSHDGCIHLLPALPSVWHQGHLTGVRAVGNFTLGICWDDNRLQHVRLHSGSGGLCRLCYRGSELAFETDPGKTYEVHAGADNLLRIQDR